MHRHSESTWLRGVAYAESSDGGKTFHKPALQRDGSNYVRLVIVTYVSYGLYAYGLCSYGLCSHGLYSYGLCGYGLYSYGLYSYGLRSYG